MRFFRPPAVLRRRRDGRFDLVLDAGLRQALRDLLAQLDELIETGSDDPTMRRLQPPAYLDDPEREAAFRLLAGDELRTARRAAIETVLSSLDASELTDDQVWSWLQAINAIRLVVGTRLDVSEDQPAFVEIDPADPNAPLWEVYGLTSWIHGELVLALS